MKINNMLSDRIAQKIADELKLDAEQQAVIRYGAFMLLQAGACIVLSLALGVLLGVFWHVAVASLVMNLLRQYSGGAHASKPSVCLVVGTAATLVLALAARSLSGVAPIAAVAAGAGVFVFAFVQTARYAPVDSKAKPVTAPQKRAKMRRISLGILTGFVFLSAVFVAVALVTGAAIWVGLLFSLYAGVLWQTATLTITGRKILSQTDRFLCTQFFAEKESH
jgi:accessory gene regulator B